MNYNEAVAQARIAHPNWSPEMVENAARTAVLAQEKQAARDALAEAVAAATDESGQFDWSKVNPEPAWYDDDHPNSDFNAQVIVGLEAAVEKARLRGDQAEAAEAEMQRRLAAGEIAPSMRGRGGRI